VVVGTYDHYPLSLWRFTYIGVFFCSGTLYLLIILSMKITKEQQSIIAIVAGLLLFAWFRHSLIFLVLSSAIAATFFFSYLNTPIHKAWMGFSKILGAISSRCILFVIFYLFLTPISLLRKITRKQDPMRDFPGNESSGFYERNHLCTEKDFLNPW